MGFNEFSGNDQIRNTLITYLKKDRIPRSMIFHGPHSAQKEKFAVGFAKALNCEETGDDFCDRCTSCTEINKGIFPDLFILEPGGQYYRKEQITELVEDSMLKPSKSTRKVYILREADRMQASSANAFLKTLEEPGDSTVFILLTSNLAGCIPTIRSRCQILDFSHPSIKDIRERLIRRGVKPDQAGIMAGYGISDTADLMKINFQTFHKLRREVMDVLESVLLRREVDRLLTKLNGLSKNRQKFFLRMNAMIQLILVVLRDVMLFSADNRTAPMINVDCSETIAEFANVIPMGELFRMVEGMEKVRIDIRRNLNVRTIIVEFIRVLQISRDRQEVRSS